jgi:hypothetical protein
MADELDELNKTDKPISNDKILIPFPYKEYDEKFSSFFSNSQYKEALDLSVALWTEICKNKSEDYVLVSISYLCFYQD